MFKQCNVYFEVFVRNVKYNSMLTGTKAERKMMKISKNRTEYEPEK